MSSEQSQWFSVSEIVAKGVNESVTRAGIIPYAIIGRKILICLGQDREHKELTDFGGGYSIKRDINPANCALRELKEESLGLFDLQIDDIFNDNCIIMSDTLIIFHRVKIDEALSSVEEFHKLLKKFNINDVEVDSIQWVHLAQLPEYIKTGHLYDRVGKMLLPILDNITVKLKT